MDLRFVDVCKQAIGDKQAAELEIRRPLDRSLFR